MEYTVTKTPTAEAKEFVKTHHYSRGIHNGPMTYGLYDKAQLIGVCAFATPSSEAVCASVFGVEEKRSVTELHRLVLLDEAPKNTESYFVARALKLLKSDRPNYKAVLSFADSTQGHRGTIYQASNALFCGMTASAKFYMDQDGRLRHPRQNGINITRETAKEKGWSPVKRQAKYRYLFLLGGKFEKRDSRKRLLLNTFEYPREETN